jgi:hypothetical protein
MGSVLRKLLKEFRFDESLGEAVVKSVKYTSNTYTIRRCKNAVAMASQCQEMERQCHACGRCDCRHHQTYR